MELYFILISIIAFVTAVLLAAGGILLSAPGLIQEDISMLDTIEELHPIELAKELLLLMWDSREFLYHSALAFAVGLACLILSQTAG